MQISDKGVTYLESYEHFEPVSYQDSNGTWTIGFGTTRIGGLPVREGMTCDIWQARAWEREDLAWAEEAVNSKVLRPMKQYQFDAFVIFTYNIGAAGFASSSALARFNAGLTYDVPAAMCLWDKETDPETKKLRRSNGLVARRYKEAAMFLGGFEDI